MELEPVIGLEVHAQLKTKSKLFCSCTTKFGAPPNEHTCPVCLGMPGVLPVLNKTVLEFSIMLGLATNCRITEYSVFARKNYFYPDLPKGYQISQYELPICSGGRVEVPVNGEIKIVGLTRIHMEEDAGKLVHPGSITSSPYSLVDFNRSCVPLIEIVSEPDIRSAREAGAYLRTLRTLVRYLGICDGNMEEGSFRCDANVSVRPKGSETLGTRTELKNMNSFRHVEAALAYEIERQSALVREGGRVYQDTRSWDVQKNRTISIRGKEEAQDYRYFPDPDLVPLEVDEAWVERLRAQLPELPRPKMLRFQEQYGLPAYDAAILTEDRALADYFEAAAAAVDPKAVSNWIMGDVLHELKGDAAGIAGFAVAPEHLGDMVKMIETGEITGKIAKEVIFPGMIETGRAPQEIKDRAGVEIASSNVVAQAVDRVLTDCPEEVARYREGQKQLLGYFMGRVMKLTKGQADPKEAQRLLREKLGG